MSHAFSIEDPIDLRASLTLASSCLSHLLANSLRLTRQSNATDIILNDADYDVSVAEAKVSNADDETFTRLKEEKAQEDTKLKEDLEQRVSAVTTDFEAATEQADALAVRVRAIESDVIMDEGPIPQEPNSEHASRISRALEEAKKRNTTRPTDVEDYS